MLFAEQRALFSTELARLELSEREKTKISSLKIGHSSVHGHFIEVSSNFKNKVPERYRRKQTLKNAERYDINELTEIDVKLSEIDIEIEKLEQQIFIDLCGELKKSGGFLLKYLKIWE